MILVLVHSAFSNRFAVLLTVFDAIDRNLTSECRMANLARYEL